MVGRGMRSCQGCLFSLEIGLWDTPGRMRLLFYAKSDVERKMSMA